MKRGQNIRKTGSGDNIRYEVRWRTVDGKHRSKTFKTRQAAVDFQAERRADVARGLRADEAKGSRPLSHYSALMMERKRLGVGTKEVREVTLDGYAAYLDRYAKPYGLLDLPVEKVTRAVLLEYVEWLARYRTPKGYGLSPSTIAKAFIPVRLALATALGDGALYANPASGMHLPTSNPAPRPSAAAFAARPIRDRALTDDQLAAICDALSDTDPTGLDCLVVAFLANTGLRAAELAGLNVGDINTFRKTVSVTKTRTRKNGAWVVGRPKSQNSTREVPLAPFLVELLRDYLGTIHPNPHDLAAPLFPARVPAGGCGVRQPDPNGSKHLPVTATTPPSDPAVAFDWSSPIEMGTFLQRRFRPAVRRAAEANPALGLPQTLRVHDLRHTFGTTLVKQGVAIEEVSRIMGHGSIAITDSLYIHIDAGTLHSAVAGLCNPLAKQRSIPEPVKLHHA